MAGEKPRILQDGRDIVISMLVIMGLAVLTVSFTGLCTFSVGRPENGPVREVDGHTALSLEARALAFPIRVPETPEGWINNSARRTSVDGHPATVQGWVTKNGDYVQITQTDQPYDRVLHAEGTGIKTAGDDVTIGGVVFHTFRREEAGKDDVWVADRGTVRWALSGSANAQEFHQLAEQVVAAEPLPHTAVPHPSVVPAQ